MVEGKLLSISAIEEKLKIGEIFRKNSWRKEHFRGAAYDLTMADDLMVVPDPPNSPGGRRFRRGEKRTSEVILNPGDVAFVSSREKFCVPWNIAGNLGAKFGLTAKGVLVLTGMCIDPGYGLTQRDDTEDLLWYPKADQRIHVLLANVGPKPVVLIPGKQRIATVQFFQVDEPADKKETHSLGYQGVEEDFFDSQGDDAGLVFFRDMAEVRNQVKDFKQQIEQFDLRITSVESSSSQIVVFGIFVISASLIGASFAAILSVISNLKKPFLLPTTEGAFLFFGIMVVGCITCSFLSSYLIHRFVKPAKPRKR